MARRLTRFVILTIFILVIVYSGELCSPEYLNQIALQIREIENLL